MTDHRSSYSSTHQGRPQADPDQVGWVRLLVRMFLIVVPAQVVGILIGGQIVVATGQLADNPGLSNLITVISGAISGTALGLILSPAARRRRLYLIASASLGVLIVLLLLVLAHLRRPAGTVDLPWTAYILGPVLLAGVQTVVAWGLWEIKNRMG